MKTVPRDLGTFEVVSMAHLLHLTEGLDPETIVIEYEGCGSHRFGVTAYVTVVEECGTPAYNEGRLPEDPF